MFGAIAIDDEKRPLKGEKAAEKIRELLLGACRISQGDTDAENQVDGGDEVAHAKAERDAEEIRESLLDWSDKGNLKKTNIV